MLIKPVDDKSRRLAFLLNLYDSPMLNEEQKKWLDEELWRVRRSFLGEETSASFIDSCFAESGDYAVLHDLRLRLRDGATRLDHVLLARNCAFIVETRDFEGDITIDANGDFTIDFADGKSQHATAPMQRGQRHANQLQEFLEVQGIKVRGAALPVYHLALLPDESTIRRPPAEAFDTSNVIKAKAFKAWVEEVCSRHAAGKLKSLWSREKDSLREWAEKIASHHHMDNPFFLPKFLRPKKTTTEAPQAAADTPQPEEMPPTSPQSDMLPFDTAPAAAALGDVLAPAVDAAEATTDFFVDAQHHDGAEAATEFFKPERAAGPEATTEFPVHHDYDHAPTEFLESGHTTAPEATTEFLERHEDDHAPTQFLAHHDGDHAPTEFLELPPGWDSPGEATAAAAAPLADTCAICGRPLMPGMVKFCLAHPRRFGGKLYCFTHQDDFPPVPEEGA